MKIYIFFIWKLENKLLLTNRTEFGIAQQHHVPHIVYHKLICLYKMFAYLSVDLISGSSFLSMGICTIS